MNNGLLTKLQITDILVVLLNQINTYISQENKKSEVDEITENIGILYTKEIADFLSDADKDKYSIGKLSIFDFVEVIANSKVKSYKSLTNKTIFKFMDMMEILHL